jgi:prepilin-type N-terminal cleavage/methylation domain-containing protein
MFPLFKKQNAKKIHIKGGFTLIEMIIAVSLFVVVMVISMGALLSMIDANRKAQALRTVMDNLNFAVENVTREMRVGFDYHCGLFGNFDDPRDCPLGGDTIIAFKDSEGELMVFRFENGRIEKSVDSGATYLGITAPEIVIDMDNSRFYVLGSQSNDTLQPKVVMVVRGTAGLTEKVRTTFNLQTTASQRLLDI